MHREEGNNLLNLQVIGALCLCMAAKKALLADAIVPLCSALGRPHVQDSSDPNKERCRQPREGPKKGHKDDQRLKE